MIVVKDKCKILSKDLTKQDHENHYQNPENSNRNGNNINKPNIEINNIQKVTWVLRK